MLLTIDTIYTLTYNATILICEIKGLTIVIIIITIIMYTCIGEL